jgi:hypothetical protein
MGAIEIGIIGGIVTVLVIALIGWLTRKPK